MYTGAWYPRTTLHLSEVFQFLHDASSDLPLKSDTMKRLQKKLELVSVTREIDDFECIVAHTKNGVVLRYYEDGLYSLEHTSEDIVKSSQIVDEYMIKKMNVALSYLFSLGAPTPKVLANIKTDHPHVISLSKKEWAHFPFLGEKYGEVYSQLESQGVTVYKTITHIFVVSDHPKSKNVQSLIEMQIFFREFKDQLKRYLNIHRTIWEDISQIKEQKSISSKEIVHMRNKLDGYQKTISLITNRINQMSTYIETRSKIAQTLDIEKHLNILFQYKFEALRDTHIYIKEIWKMTSDYIDSAIQIIVEIQNQSTQKSIQSLQLITLANVIATLLTKMALDTIPGITQKGFLYVGAIIFIAWTVNTLLISLFRHIRYQIRFPEQSKL